MRDKPRTVQETPPSSEGGECRARTQSDCIGKTNKYEFQGTIILDGQTCREPTNDADCASAGGFVFKQGTVQNKCVRPRRKEDCPSSRPVYQREEGGLPLYYCRAATNARECLANTPIFEGGECRAPITSQECKNSLSECPDIRQRDVPRSKQTERMPAKQTQL